MAALSILSLPAEFHIQIFYQFTSRPCLVSFILSCKTIYSSFKAAYLENILETLRYNEIGCGLYAEILMYSLRLMEPDIKEGNVRAFIKSVKSVSNHERDPWKCFLDTLPTTNWEDWRGRDFYSESSFCYFNRGSRNCIISAAAAGRGNRWCINYRQARLLAHQICHTWLLQGCDGNAIDFSETKDKSIQPEPPTETELRRIERGVYGLWIMCNIGSLIHRPDFIAGYDREERVKMQREIRRSLISCLDVWDWRVATSLTQYFHTRLSYVYPETFLDPEAIRKAGEARMWDDDLPDDENYIYSGCYELFRDGVLASFSPPGALMFLRRDKIIASRGKHPPLSTRYVGACRDSDMLLSHVEALPTTIPSMPGLLLDEAYIKLVKASINGFGDMVGFYWLILAYSSALKPWKDIYAFYPRDKCPDRKKLPLESPRAIVEPEARVRYGRRRPTTSLTEASKIPEAPEDDGWAWKDYVDCDRCMWDDWRLEKYLAYHKPEPRS